MDSIICCFCILNGILKFSLQWGYFENTGFKPTKLPSLFCAYGFRLYPEPDGAFPTSNYVDTENILPRIPLTTKIHFRSQTCHCDSADDSIFAEAKYNVFRLGKWNLSDGRYDSTSILSASRQRRFFANLFLHVVSFDSNKFDG